MAFESKFQSRVPDDSMPDSYYQKGVNGFLSQMGLSLHSAANWRFLPLVCYVLTFCGWHGKLSWCSQCHCSLYCRSR